jgi:hypothetical protein
MPKYFVWFIFPFSPFSHFSKVPKEGGGVYDTFKKRGKWENGKKRINEIKGHRMLLEARCE